MSWIDLEDLVRSFLFCLEHDEIKGPANAVSPQPVTNREFTKTLGKVLNRPTILPIPTFAAKFAFGEMADELLLCSTRVLPEKFEKAGFKFLYPTLESSLQHQL